MYLTVRLPYICRSLERFIQKERDYVSRNNLYFRSTVSLPQQLLMSYLLSSYLWVFEIRRLILTHLVHLEIFSSLQSQHSVVICWNINCFCGMYHTIWLETTKGKGISQENTMRYINLVTGRRWREINHFRSPHKQSGNY